jgi:hypothetical protein
VKLNGQISLLTSRTNPVTVTSADPGASPTPVTVWLGMSYATLAKPWGAMLTCWIVGVLVPSGARTLIV